MLEEARRLMMQQALDLRRRAEAFRTFAEGKQGALRQQLLDLAADSDAFAARIEAALPPVPPSSPDDDPSASRSS